MTIRNVTAQAIQQSSLQYVFANNLNAVMQINCYYTLITYSIFVPVFSTIQEVLICAIINFYLLKTLRTLASWQEIYGYSTIII